MRRKVEIVLFETERVIEHPAITECPICLTQTELLTPIQAAALIQVEPRFIEQWVAEGASHGITTPGGDQRVCRNSLWRGLVMRSAATVQDDLARAETSGGTGK